MTVTTVEQVEKTKAIDYKTEYKKTDELYEGQEKVVAKGKKGKKTVVSQVVKENGETVSKEVVSTAIETKPTNKVVEQGTKKEEDSGQQTAAQQETSSASVKKGTSQNSTDNAQTSENDSSAKDSSGSSNSGSTGEEKSDSGETKSGSGQAVADYALQFVGNPYVYGGTSLTKGADCSGFTMRVYEKFGISLPHSSSSQRSYGKEVSYSDAKPGDLICYSGHVAIYIGNGKIVHASTPSSGIKVSKATYKNILTVRRFFD